MTIAVGTVIDALKYLEAGWRTVALQPRSATPYEAWEHFQAGQSLEDVERMFADRPHAGVGILTGRASGLVVVRVRGAAGQAALLDLVGEVPATTRSVASCVYDLYFQAPRVPIATQLDILRGVDVFAEGAFVLAPPSVGPGGATYRWDRLDDDGLVPRPARLLRHMRDLLVP